MFNAYPQKRKTRMHISFVNNISIPPFKHLETTKVHTTTVDKITAVRFEALDQQRRVNAILKTRGGSRSTPTTASANGCGTQVALKKQKQKGKDSLSDQIT